jgi:hypothetical protein
MRESTPPLPQYFIAWCSVKKKAQAQLYLLPLLSVVGILSSVKLPTASLLFTRSTAFS